MDRQPPPLIDPSADLVAGLLTTADRLVTAADRLEVAGEHMLMEGGDKAAHRLLWEVPGAVDRVVLPRIYWKWAGIHAAVLALVFAAGVGVTWLVTPSVHCAPQAGGGIYCGYWLSK